MTSRDLLPGAPLLTHPPVRVAPKVLFCLEGKICRCMRSGVEKFVLPRLCGFGILRKFMEMCPQKVRYITCPKNLPLGLPVTAVLHLLDKM